MNSKPHLDELFKKLSFESSHPIQDALSSQGIMVPGVYVFWWSGEKTFIINSNRELMVKTKNSPASQEKESDWERIVLGDDDDQPICLYAGKSKNIRKRVAQHLLLKYDHLIHKDRDDYPKKSKAKTTSCQLRYGIEHILYKSKIQSFIELIEKNIKISFLEENSFKERFYLEDLAIGYFRPWFNVDSER